ncbi:MULTISPECIES: LysR family transcriptional regulator [Marinobacterium]|jgi:DNA-binding transcriptional LysR family regulator|uniref:DNA-binding transcriptional regulator, LysR family n=1 Tax=Marinobacterium iners DSM 11526 TaxID=1122198 RepID=A0A1H4F6F4_9GAMM|nr:LysR family transcriptional regulator [Marinobacterium iners]QSR34955.1 transcriptional regulator [Marinobacterium iners]SEA92873.1 DNA-binding transcriptional regulator, LysR family [Marinobacterium iners DSM 11526]
MNLNDLSLFIRVVETGSFTAAADSLNVQKSTISRRIAQLEDTLGIRLIQRTTRKLKLTPEGEELFNRAQPLVDDLEAVQDDISASKTELRGRLRLTMPTEIGVFMMNEVITSFMQTYPKLEVDVELSTRTVDLIEEGVDLALRLGPLPNSSLIARHIAGLHRGLFATPEYLEQHGMPKTPDDLAHHQCISLLKPFDHLRFTNWNDNEPVTMGGRLRTNSMSFVREMILQGMGIGRLPEVFCGELVKTGRIVRVLDEFTLDPLEINALYASRRNLNPRVRAFLDHMSERLRDHPWVQNRLVHLDG